MRSTSAAHARRRRSTWPVVALVLAALSMAACSSSGDVTTTIPDASSTADTPPPTTTGPAPQSTTTEPTTTGPTTGPTSGAFPDIEEGEVVNWVPEVLDRRPHDPDAFTQGLLLDGDVVFESTGLYGESTLREVDPETGEVIRSVDLDPELFGEGLELVDDRLLQLTWQEQTLVVWDAATLEELDRLAYEGEGWGLCLGDDDRLVMSDGSATLTFRDTATFEPLGQVDVTRDGSPVAMLNELECVDGLVFANVWQTDEMVAIDPATGAVVAVIDAAGLQAELPPGSDHDVLNGIAHDPEADTFLVTGKLWPTVFEVRFVPAG
jgi:glutamine cyclotransferase